ncbi:survivin-like protein [Leptotrombidium deliense]|uniref:Survivin-like protein n=1 Tax=Leptotrombidium deliense TaxID=299467 RepID=A0A443SII1_9ACAR|nr:survivin-like protein [Leptotrombidium deliense]
MELTMEDVFQNKDSIMISEENRLKSFAWWPFNSGPCVKEEMAKAGFYHCNEGEHSDHVRCFCCFKELDNWSEDDQPFKEHIKHSKECAFAKIGKQQSTLSCSELLSILEAREVNKSNKILDKAMEKWSVLDEKEEKVLVSKKFSK